METRRLRPRQRRRLEVLLGGKLPAVTADVSPGGLCAELPQVFLPGSLVQGSVRISEQEFPFLGQVAWAKPGNPMLEVRSRVGIRFLQIGEEFLAVYRRDVRHRVRRARRG